MKKLFAAVMALVMALVLLPTVAFAEDGKVRMIQIYTGQSVGGISDDVKGKILFISAAEGGKNAISNESYQLGGVGNMESGLTEIPESTGINNWRLTLKRDGNSSFSVTVNNNSELTREEGYSDWTVKVTYSNAATGDREYISAMLVDSSDKALYYGRIGKSSNSSDTVDVNIPTGLAVGTYTLKVFNEQYNEKTGEGNTEDTIEYDYAGGFEKNIKLTVTEKTTPTTPTITTAGTAQEIKVGANDTMEITVPNVVNSKAVTVTFDGAAVSKISESGNLTLNVKDNTAELSDTLKNSAEVKGKDATSIVITLTNANNEPVFTESNSGGKAVVSVPYKTGLTSEKIKVFYVNDNKLEAQAFEYNALTGRVTLTLSHFSEYLITSEPTESDVVTTQGTNRAYIVIDSAAAGTATTAKADSAKTFDAGVGIYAATAVLSVTGMAWVGKKKH